MTLPVSRLLGESFPLNKRLGNLSEAEPRRNGGGAEPHTSFKASVWGGDEQREEEKGRPAEPREQAPSLKRRLPMS